MGLIDKAFREAKTLSVLLRTLRRMRRLSPSAAYTVADVLEEWADKTPEAVALHFEKDRYTYKQLEESANRVANWAEAKGVEPGQVVALLMENRPEFLFAWLGLAKAGAVSALINTNLRHGQLVHALRVSKADTVIVGGELAEALHEVRNDLESPLNVWCWGRPASELPDSAALDSALAEASERRPSGATRAGVKSGDPLFYIYTSGTTGNPKAAKFSHFRFLEAGNAFGTMGDITSDDRIYCVLPLYHTAGGVIALSMSLIAGATFVLKRKFSARAFFPDCREHGVTVFQYIGELCRYLVNQPPSPADSDHSVRLATGNGLRPDIWEEFQERFAIPRIMEFYGATEGNVGIINLDNTPCAIGRVPPYLRNVFGIKLVKFDVGTEAHVRDENGHCIECGPDEVGEAIGRIPEDKEAPIGRFEGYTTKEETEKKILRDVFDDGDAWFRTGDLLRCDAEGYYYFVDRIGDTFRWKGENVATSEVAETLSRCRGVEDVNVYGVTVPGTDGRAGMASLVCGEEFDLDAFYSHMAAKLAPYARPLFVRMQKQLTVTATFKHRKVDLVEQGYDPEQVSDPVYFRDDEANKFVPVDGELYGRIVGGNVRL